MGSQGRVGDQLRAQLRGERERRGWSQAKLSQVLSEHGIDGKYPSTITKIESGDRAVHADELVAFAEIFGISVDALLGRTGGTDMAASAGWAASKLTATAQKTASEVRGLHDRIDMDLADVRYYAANGYAEATENIMGKCGNTLAALRSAEAQLNELAGQFPLPH